MSWWIEYRDIRTSRDLQSRRTETIDAAVNMAFEHLRKGDRVYRICSSGGMVIDEAGIQRRYGQRKPASAAS